MNKRNLDNTPGIKPPRSFLIHPATMNLIENNKKTNTSKLTKLQTEDFLIPQINITPQNILSIYNIKYISDLEDNLNDFPDNNKYRLIKLFFQNNDIKNINKESLPNIISFLTKFTKLSTSDIIKNLKSKNI